jgi:hypothetical protein
MNFAGRIVVVVLLTAVARCNDQDNATSTILPLARSTEEVEALSLFVPIDTVQLDPNIVVAAIRFLDVSDSGRLLVSDYTNQIVHVFEPTGEHIRTLRTGQCSPEHSGRPKFARFVANDEVVVAVEGGASFLFDSTGQCVELIRSLTPTPSSICFGRDSLYGYFDTPNVPTIRSYGRHYESVRDYELVSPTYPRLASVYRGFGGLELTCANEDVYYLFPGQSDAISLFAYGSTTRFEAPYFKAPHRDRKRLRDTADRLTDAEEIRSSSTLAVATFALDDRSRLIVHRIPSATDPRRTDGYGLTVVLEGPNTRGYSTIVPFAPTAVRNQKMYVIGDNEWLDTDELGNQQIMVFRFMEPT